MDDTGFLLLGVLVASILVLIPVGMLMYVAVGPVAENDE